MKLEMTTRIRSQSAFEQKARSGVLQLVLSPTCCSFDWPLGLEELHQEERQVDVVVVR